MFACFNCLKKQYYLLQSCADKFLQKNIKMIKKLEILETQNQEFLACAKNDQCLLFLKTDELFNFFFDDSDSAIIDLLNSSFISVDDSS